MSLINYITQKASELKAYVSEAKKEQEDSDSINTKLIRTSFDIEEAKEILENLTAFEDWRKDRLNVILNYYNENPLELFSGKNEAYFKDVIGYVEDLHLKENPPKSGSVETSKILDLIKRNREQKQGDKN